jgi:hypothetical protein
MIVWRLSPEHPAGTVLGWIGITILAAGLTVVSLHSGKP